MKEQDEGKSRWYVESERKGKKLQHFNAISSLGTRQLALMPTAWLIGIITIPGGRICMDAAMMESQV